jgi:ceramide glucosyltransferase
MVGDALVVLTVLGWCLVVIMLSSLRRLLHAQPPAVSALGSPVSILKPLKGVDPDLEANLQSFYRLDYPEYELVFGVSDPRDPGLGVARRVAALYPQVPTRFVANEREIGFNPKVNNLANILSVARHELILISDSNVAVPPDHLSRMVAELERPGVGLVTAPIRGVAGSGLGGTLEGLQLNTFVAGGVAALDGLFGRVCAMGKSMLLRRADLERIGGLEWLARFLAEDQVCGEAIRSLGLDTVVAPAPADNVLGAFPLRGFASRHLRWARIRRHTAPIGYFGEALTNPLLPALAHLAVVPGRLSLALAVATLALLSMAAMYSERLLGVRRRMTHYPALELMRGAVVAALWIVPLLSSTVVWRGHRFRIGRRTLVHPTGDLPWATGDDLASDEVHA